MMKAKLIINLFLLTLTLSACSTKTANDSVSSETTSEVSRQEQIDLVGTYYTASGETATIEQTGNDSWQVNYSTADGIFSSTFETEWEKESTHSLSKTKMKKSDGYSGFDIIIDYKSASDVIITMTDGNSDHEMVFTSEKPKEDDIYDVVLKGDLSPFAGQFSNDEFNRVIAESGFTYGGYSPEDFYNNRTSIFRSITEHGYWNGFSSHGNYEVRVSDMPKKVDGYYEVTVYGTNPGANDGVLTFYLVPPKVKGPDGTVSEEKRVFEENLDGELRLLEYQKDEWWKAY